MNVDLIAIASGHEMDLPLNRAHCGGRRSQTIPSGRKVVGKVAVGARQKLNVATRVILGREKEGRPGHRVPFPEHHPLKSRRVGGEGSGGGKGLAGKGKKKEDRRKPSKHEVPGGGEW